VAKLHNTHSNDTLSTQAHPVRMPIIQFPDPLVTYAVRAVSRNDEEKLQQGMHRLHDEDLTFQTHYNTETHETIVEGLGERHVEVAMARLARQFGVRAELSSPRIAYRETITVASEGQGRHKKQSGGRGQFGDCWVRLKPAPRGAGYKFEDEIVGGAIPRNYIPAVDRGIQEASARGIIARHPVVDFVAECYDGSYHSVDSNEASFKMAGILAFRTVAAKCKPALLEPLDTVEIRTPETYLGDVMGDLNSRRGHIHGTDTLDDGQGSLVRAVVPQAELHLYGTKLSSLTHGRGTFRRMFKSYEFAPPDHAKKVIEASGKAED
jgi:elongation factor G